jgi:2-polyprenyl-3-methyl-5-hydroxy-6-metoxy-1,4-benzoquinol methylase
MNYKNLYNCLCCSNKNLSKILDLKEQPLANSYSKADVFLESYPLELNICQNCFHGQLSCAVDPDLMFKNYLYVSGTSKTLRDYFDWFANYCKENNPNSKTIFDIACNDGSQLDSFQKIGYKTYGIDPAKNLYNTSTKNGHEIICEYFNTKNIISIKNSFNVKYFDIITAQNVFAHNSNPLDFLKACAEIMNDESVLYIQTSQATMIENNEFDTIYHEHISFFNANSMQKLVARSGLHLNDVVITPIHGNSYVFSISKRNECSEKLIQRIDYENKIGLYTKNKYYEYKKKCLEVKTKLNAKIKEFKDRNYKCVGYGAAAKGVVLLNFTKINLDFVIDDNPLKHDLFMPGTNIPIYGLEKLAQYKNEKILLLPLAWNFYNEIKNKTLSVLPNGATFIKFFPEIVVE